jgi:hypothetical protein
MAIFKAEHFFDFAEHEVRSARLVLVLIVTPLVFLGGALEFVRDLNTWAKLAVTTSVGALAIAMLLWGTCVLMGELSLVSARHKRATGAPEADLEQHIEEAWKVQDRISSRLFLPTCLFMGVGYLGIVVYFILAIWS